MTQEISASEEQFYPGRINWQYLLSLEREDVDTEQARVHDFYYKPMFIKKFGKILTFVFFGLRQELKKSHCF